MMDFHLRELPLVRKELKDKEKKNVLKRVREGNETVDSTLRRVVKEAGIILPAHTSLPQSEIFIGDEKYLSHIDTWHGLHGTRAELAHKTIVDLRKGANNWANGRRAIVLAQKVLPDYLDQVQQHCANVSRQLFPVNPQHAKDFEELVIPAAYFDLLEATVKLNNRATATPLFCENAIIKYGLDEKLKEILPTNVDVVQTAKRLAVQATNGGLGGDLRSSNTTTTPSGGRRRKRRGNDHDMYLREAFKQHFEDVYTHRLREYLRVYGTEDAATATVATTSPVLMGNTSMPKFGGFSDTGLPQSITMSDLSFPNTNPLDQLNLAMAGAELQLPYLDLQSMESLNSSLSAFKSKLEFQIKFSKAQMHPPSIGVVGLAFAAQAMNAAALFPNLPPNIPPTLPPAAATIAAAQFSDLNSRPPPLDRPANSIGSTLSHMSQLSAHHSNHSSAHSQGSTATPAPPNNMNAMNAMNAMNMNPNSNPASVFNLPTRISMPSMSGMPTNDIIDQSSSRKRAFVGDSYDATTNSAPKRVKTDDFMEATTRGEQGGVLFDSLPDSIYPSLFSNRNSNDSIFNFGPNQF